MGNALDLPIPPVHRSRPSMLRFQLRRPYVSGILACTLFLFLCAYGYAERADQTQPIYIQADHATYDDVKQVSILSGHVIITQGRMTLKGNRVTVREDPEGYYFLSSTAGPGARAYFRTKREGVDEYIEGEGERIDYDGKSEITTLSHRAVVRRTSGRAHVIDEVHGSLIRYDRYHDIYTAHGGAGAVGPDNPTGRVRAILSPRRTATVPAQDASIPLDMSTPLKNTIKP